MFGVACLAIVKAIDKLPPSIDNVAAFIVMAVSRAIRKYKANLPIIRIPLTSEARMKQGEMEQVVLPSVVDIDYHNPLRLHDGFEQVDCDEIVDKICYNETERAVVELRAQGYTDTEVGLELGLGKSAVCKLRQRLQSRYNNVRR